MQNESDVGSSYGSNWKGLIAAVNGSRLAEALYACRHWLDAPSIRERTGICEDDQIESENTHSS
jgi:hypothetical protein